MTQISEITAVETTALSDTDLLEGEESGGTSFRFAYSLLKSSLKTYFDSLDQTWIEVADNWAYASASTITVPAGATSIYKKGWGVRWKQGGSYKYAYMTTVASALLTVNGGTDYTVANSAITNIAVTPSPNTAFGFPEYFNYTPTAGGALTIGNGSTFGRFSIWGSFIDIWAGATLGSSSSMGTGSVTLTPPITLDVTDLIPDLEIGLARVLDSGTGRYKAFCEVGNASMAIYNLSVSGSQVVRSNFTSSVPITWATGDMLYLKTRVRY